MNSDARSGPCFTIFGGPNGSGKSTAYDRFVDAGFDSGEYLNPDDVAKALSGDGTGAPAFDMRAGREVIRRTRALMAARRSFVRESTLSSQEILRSTNAAKMAGYRVVMVFVAVSSAATTRGRVAIRVAKGGHDIPDDAQERRFPRALDNAPQVARLVDVAYFLDNGGFQHKLVATVRAGTVAFLEPREASWVERATLGLPRTSVQKSRNDALAELRELEGLSENLQVREGRAVYAAEMPAELRSA